MPRTPSGIDLTRRAADIAAFRTWADDVSKTAASPDLPAPAMPVRSQTPTFQRQDVSSLAEGRTVIPHGVFVAARKAFRCTTVHARTADEARAAIFENPPLTEFGWDIDTTHIAAAAPDALGSVWLVARA